MSRQRRRAQLGLTREWPATLAPWGARANAVIPAKVLAPMYQDWLLNFPHPAADKAKITARTPLGLRMTDAREIAASVVFPLWSRAAHTTAQCFFVDGGCTHIDQAIGT